MFQSKGFHDLSMAKIFTKLDLKSEYQKIEPDRSFIEGLHNFFNTRWKKFLNNLPDDDERLGRFNILLDTGVPKLYHTILKLLEGTSASSGTSNEETYQLLSIEALHPEMLVRFQGTGLSWIHYHVRGNLIQYRPSAANW